jgi:NAD(P)-dependent dehydrogenase (short-subunit alcohol dehydrogenase family)
MRFQDKVALISGAGAGIGRATASIIGREGGTVVAVDLDQAALDKLAAENGSSRTLTVRADALDAGAVEGVVGRAVDAHGRIDILVNAVGGSTIISCPNATLEELTLEEWQKLIHFNLTGTFLFCHAVTPVMKRQGSGKIVNISSIAGRGLSRASSSAYATPRAASSRSHASSRSSSGRTGSRSMPSHPASHSPSESGLTGSGARTPSEPPRSSALPSVGSRTPRTRLASSASSLLPTPISSRASPSTSPAASRVLAGSLPG